VDFELSLSMPRPLTAHVGVDTLTHGIEAYVSKKANGMTDPLVLSCIALVANNLLTAWREPDNRAAREAMALAAFQGGAAFANASVCLVHGLSRPLGAVYHVPHGLSNAVLLPAVTKFSISGAMQRYGVVAQVMGLAQGSDDAETAAHKLVDGLEFLNDQLQIPPLRDCVKVGRAKFEQSLDKLAQDALASGSPQNNPVVPTVEEMVGLYQRAW
jgi:alcohol dehydrogenase class IV